MDCGRVRDGTFSRGRLEAMRAGSWRQVRVAHRVCYPIGFYRFDGPFGSVANVVL